VRRSCLEGCGNLTRNIKIEAHYHFVPLENVRNYRGIVIHVLLPKPADSSKAARMLLRV
jgi:hypothetical protein